MRVVKGADLFCGAGGTSTGFLRALKKLGVETSLIAVNHWATAIDTHKLNHPLVSHVNSDLERVDPRELVPGGYLDFLWASPECTYYSNALGGKPVNNQSRATPKWVLKWLSLLDIQMFAMENVPEFRGWGPCHRTCNCSAGAKTYREGLKMLEEDKHEKKCVFQKPIKSRRGEYYRHFMRKLQALGYRTEARVLCAADYGAPTTRKRLFVVGSKDGVIRWPEPTHSKPSAQRDMFAPRRKWKTADKHVIDWTKRGESIFTREKPLSPKTMRRIWEGFWKFNGKAFMLNNQSGALPQAVDESPVPTMTANGSIRLFEPFIVKLDNGGSVRDINRPMYTLTSADASTLVQPYIMPYLSERAGQKIRARSTKLPMTTVAGSRVHALAEPILISLSGTSDDAISSSSRRVSEPVPTVRGNGHFGIAQPYITEYYGTGGSLSTKDVVPTVTGNDRFGLVEPVLVKDEQGNLYILDILYRMFTKKEYAKAQGFPKNYRFKGGSKAVMKQIGNAVPPVFAEAITYANMKERIQ